MKARADFSDVEYLCYCSKFLSSFPRRVLIRLLLPLVTLHEPFILPFTSFSDVNEFTWASPVRIHLFSRGPVND